MKTRHIQSRIEQLALSRKKMAFISGPRQCGKTTLAKRLLRTQDLYFNWDQLKFRQRWNQDPDAIAGLALETKNPRLALDEIHKNKRWKTELKGFFDEYGDKIEIIVTGSARLNTYRKGGDSLLGRYYHFHLHPLSLSEYIQSRIESFDSFTNFVSSQEIPASQTKQEAVEDLLKFGGFPEPLLTGQEDVHQLWQKNRLELLVRQDLRDLSRINELSQVEVLASLLPLKIGSPLSVQSLREDIEVAFTTVQRWLKYLEALYFQFEIKPHSKSVTRSLKKEGKIYLFDWSMIDDPGPRFENMVASHLLKFCHHWSDLGVAQLQLSYLRDKEKNEVDFLILKNKKPWFTVEAKLNDPVLNKTFQVFQRQLHVPHFQIVMREDIGRVFKTETGSARVVSFAKFFSLMP